MLHPAPTPHAEGLRVLVTVTAAATSVHRCRTPRGEDYAVVQLARQCGLGDVTAISWAVVFPAIYQAYGHLLDRDTLDVDSEGNPRVQLIGRLDGPATLIATALAPPAPTVGRRSAEAVTAAGSTPDTVAELVQAHLAGGGELSDATLTAAVAAALDVTDRTARRRLQPYRDPAPAPLALVAGNGGPSR